jgi:hypothetical protein
MPDQSLLLNILRLNGVNQLSSLQQVEVILNALKYSPEAKQQTLAFLKGLGWALTDNIPVLPVSPIPPTIPVSPTPAPAPIVPVPPVAPTPVPVVVQVQQTPPIQPQNPILTPQLDTTQVGSQFSSPTNVQVPVSPVVPQSANLVGLDAAIQQSLNKSTLSVGSKKGIIIAVIGIVIFVIVSLLFLYFMKSSFFVKGAYTESNLLTGLLTKSAEINSSSYESSISLDVVAREKDAKPFTLPPVSPDLKVKYDNDVIRSQDVSNILTSLQNLSASSYKYEIDPKTNAYKSVLVSARPYPSTLVSVEPKAGAYVYGHFKTVDPVSNQAYKYVLTDGGKNFALTVNFETDTAVSQLRKTFSYYASTTVVKGNSVTFTKDNSSYSVSLPTEQPQPFLAQMGEEARMLPSDMSATLSFGATADLSKKVADWLFNIKASGSMGDLTYAVDVEARKKNGDYYFRINKIPSLFGAISNVKGKWIEVSKESASLTKSGPDSYDELSMIAWGLSSGEKSYKENREAAVKTLRQIVTIADDNKLIAFRSNPKNEKIGDRSLTRYDLQIRKEAIVPFYKKLLEESSTNKDLAAYVDAGALSYLQSKEFDLVFDYINTNTLVTLWVDGNGFPAILETRFRIVPSDIATQFKDKQANLVFKFSLSNINKSVSIDVPSGVTPIKDVIEEINNGSGRTEARAKGADAAIKANLANIRAEAELYFDSTGSTYGSSSNSCTSGMFASRDISASITSVTTSSGGAAICHSKATAWALSAPLKTDATKYWCVDSSGASKQITTKLVGTKCP